MKILIAHNSYQQAGGEDSVVNAEIELLRQHGHEVIEYRRHNQEIRAQGVFATAWSAIWSQQTQADLNALLRNHRFDLIHAHNTFPLISASLYWLASAKKIPLVQTLHNFRLLCPQAMFLREGRVCEDCLGHLPWRAIPRQCYHDSATQSALVTSMLVFHRSIGSYQHHVSAYIALNQFCKDKFVQGGFPAEKIHIKAHFTQTEQVPDWRQRSGAYFIGRMSEEKGVLQLMAVHQILRTSGQDIPIMMVGQGPLADRVSAEFGDRYLGPKTSAEVRALLHSALFLVAPSTCYETFGLAVIEAYSAGVAVIASAHGGLRELVTEGVTGLLCRPGDTQDLVRKITWAHEHPEEMREMGQRAYQYYLEKFTPEHNYHRLMEIYKAVLRKQDEFHG